MRYFKKLVGERVYLSPVNPDDAEQVALWMNDRAVSEPLGNHDRVISAATERAFLEKPDCEWTFAIVRAEDDALLGNISLKDVLPIHRRATLGIFIGEASARGQGYGTEAIRLLVEYGFETLNLRNIMLWLHADNERALRCYQKAGFREFGRRTGCLFVHGEYIDEISMERINPKG